MNTPTRTAYKILNRMDRFVSVAEAEIAISEDRVYLSDSEDILGLYKNEHESIGDVLVTSVGIHLLSSNSEKSQRIPYSQIAGTTTEHVCRLGSPSVRISTVDGQAIVVPILGRKGKFFDAYEFHRYLLRVSGN